MKKIWVLIVIAVIVLGIIFIPKLLFNEGDKTVNFTEVSKNQIPSKLQEVLPSYKTEERALACKVKDEIYIIVTRGEKRTEGYSVAVEKIEKLEKDNETHLIVYAVYEDPKPDEIVAQVITYPYTVVKTDLKELPDKVKLKTRYKE
ncbi:protease complex subunit PrcB family protein [Caldisalinibacter kiritimatiensis]|uniref:PrcB C-terminal domain-containing protein n=1 Tax=Caldisalinibacter kiritimatiensis TaxID=1304284 RepID=R1CB64_9FIRM|nr:protease complex subunit PrcB family protein [Caldisalinibacter kiritimatiensis]EOC99544.1 hypothetical protein L21TH_2456 [Caldisalinibacter kiritimatiensis]